MDRRPSTRGQRLCTCRPRPAVDQPSWGAAQGLCPDCGVVLYNSELIAQVATGSQHSALGADTARAQGLKSLAFHHVSSSWVVSDSTADPRRAWTWLYLRKKTWEVWCQIARSSPGCNFSFTSWVTGTRVPFLEVHAPWQLRSNITFSCSVAKTYVLISQPAGRPEAGGDGA